VRSFAKSSSVQEFFIARAIEGEKSLAAILFPKHPHPQVRRQITPENQAWLCEGQAPVEGLRGFSGPGREATFPKGFSVIPLLSLATEEQHD
jgi:hypothetical protein